MKIAIAVALFLTLCGFAVARRLRALAPTAYLRSCATWYGEGCRGRTMANGQMFDPEAMTCAAWDWPFGTLLRVTHSASGRHVFVEVTDHGPAKWTGCAIDLSARAFRRLAPSSEGKIKVEISVVRLGPATP